MPGFWPKDDAKSGTIRKQAFNAKLMAPAQRVAPQACGIAMPYFWPKEGAKSCTVGKQHCNARLLAQIVAPWASKTAIPGF